MPEPPPLRVRRLRPTARLPQRATPHSSGLDLYADFGDPKGEVTLGRTPTLVPIGIAVEVPPGFEIQIRPRSGLSRQGVIVAFGTVDADYRGELKVNLAVSVGSFVVRQGERVAQLVVAPVALSAVQEVTELTETARGDGGFGSTGR
jgi:dUTP pyrophosphatase